VRAVADASTRRRFNNEGIVLGQIGVEIAACKTMLYEAGFGNLLTSPGKGVSLADGYRHKP